MTFAFRRRFKERSVIGNWLKRKVQIAAVKAATEDLERFLKTLRGASDEVIGTLLVFATMIRVNQRKIGRLPDNYLRIPTPGDGSMGTPLYLSNLIKAFQKDGQHTAASGTMVWLHSLRSLAYPELRVLGREMWGELQRGFPYVERSFSEIEAMRNSPVSAEVRREAKFVPSDLAPLAQKDSTRFAEGLTRGLLNAASADLNSRSGSASANGDRAKTECQERHLQEEQDDRAQLIVAMGRLLNAKSAREVAEMTLGRPMTEEEWMEVWEPWERNWKS